MANRGIVNKVWNIKGDTGKRGASAQIRDSIGYILDEEKTDVILTMYGSAINDPSGQLNRECKYVANDVKTARGALVGSVNLISSDPLEATREMMRVKSFYHKLDERSALHGVISLDSMESDPANAPLLMRLCEDVLKEVFPNHQAIFAVHTNTDNLHVHFIINSVGLNGRKIHQDDKFIVNVLHPTINKYARKYGFTEQEAWKKTQADENKEYSFIDDKIKLRKLIDLAIEETDNIDDFISYLEGEGVIVNLGKHLSLRLADMTKAVRSHRLGSNYTLSAITERLITKSTALKEVSISKVVEAPEVSEVMWGTYMPLKRYRELSDKEKAYVRRELSMGRNPWRNDHELSWQINHMRDEINREEKVKTYVKNLTANGDIHTAMDELLKRKRRISSEKKEIRHYMNRYKPILDICREMKKLEKKAYLYEHENAEEFRTEYDEYRELTRRLKAGYNQSFESVSDFIDRCDERLKYADAQLKELSLEYRELKNYASKKGYLSFGERNLIDQIGYEKVKENERYHLYNTDSFFIVSSDTDAILYVSQYPDIDENGELFANISVSLMNKAGKVIDSCELKNDPAGFKKFIDSLQNKYHFSDSRKATGLRQARDFIRAWDKDNPSRPISRIGDEKVSAKLAESENGIGGRNTYTFTQAINLVSIKNESGIHVITDANNPSFIALLQSNDEAITVRVIDSDGKLCEEAKLPPLSKRTSDGYKEICRLQATYGFSDNMAAFDSLEDAKQYEKEQNREYETNRQRSRRL